MVDCIGRADFYFGISVDVIAWRWAIYLEVPELRLKFKALI